MTYLNLYINFLKKFLKVKRPLKVVFDCSNGTVSPILKKLFTTSLPSHYRLITTHFINSKPDGRFPAHGPNPMRAGALRDLCSAVRRECADLGVIFDADGDRVFFVDDQSQPVLPDYAAILMSENYDGPVVLDIRLGYAAREWFKSQDRRVIDSRVGHYFVKQAMQSKKISFGAELSGHYYFRDFFCLDGGIFAAIRFINSVSRLPLKLSNWIDNLPHYFSSGEINFKVEDKRKAMKKIEKHFKKIATRVSKLDGLKMEFSPPAYASGQAWWFNLRPSNTENLLRLNLEAKDKKVFKAKISELKKLL